MNKKITISEIPPLEVLNLIIAHEKELYKKMEHFKSSLQVNFQ